jgi:hypothetical protein
MEIIIVVIDQYVFGFDLISIPIVDIVTEVFPDERKWHTSKSYRL